MAARRAGILAEALPQALAPARWLLKAAALALGLWKAPQALASLAQPMQKSEAQPVQTLRFFKEELLSGNLVTEPEWSGRALWELEAAKVEDWEGLKQADFALLRSDSGPARSMARSVEWQPVDFDDASVLYAKVEPEHAALIKARAPRGLRPGDWNEPFESSRLPQVEADLEARLLDRPKLGVLYYFEGLLWKEKGREDQARSWLEKGIKADPSFAPNYRLLGELRLKAGDSEGAKIFLEKAAEWER